MSKKSKRIYCCTSLLLGLVQYDAIADDGPSGDLLDLSLHELLNVKVTASTRTEETLKTVPSAITVFQAAQIERLGAEYLHELLDFVPGFQSQRAGDVSTMYSSSSRGRRNGSQSKELLLIVDDRVFNEPRNGSANGARFLFPLTMVEKVEVIRGPGSALYGSNAYTGVVKITTKKGSNRIKLGIGSFEKKQMDFELSQQWSDWQANFLGSYTEDIGDNYVLAAFANQPTNRVTTTDPHSRLDIDISLENKNSEIKLASTSNKTNHFYVVETVRNDVNRFDSIYSQIYLSHVFDWSKTFSSQVSVGYLMGEYDLDLQLVPAGQLSNISNPPSDEALEAKIKIESSTSSIRFHNNWDYNEIINIQFGLEFRVEDEVKARAYNNFDLRQLAENDFPINYYGNFEQYTMVGSEESRSSKSLYGQYLGELSDSLRLTLGFRYDDYDLAGSYTSPRLGLIRKINKEQTIKLLYGEAFRAPALNETQLINNSVIIGNPDLTHEIVHTWDFIWRWETSSHSIAATLFHNKFIDPIDTSLENNIRQFINGPSSFSKGIEIEASQQLTENWFLRETYSYFYDLPESAFRESDKLASFYLNYQSSNWNWNFSLVYQGEKESPSGSELLKLDSRILLNSKFIYQFDDRLTFELLTKNLTDKTIYDAASGNTLAEGLPNRGREYRLSFSWKF